VVYRLLPDARLAPDLTSCTVTTVCAQLRFVTTSWVKEADPGQKAAGTTSAPDGAVRTDRRVPGRPP